MIIYSLFSNEKFARARVNFLDFQIVMKKSDLRDSNDQSILISEINAKVRRIFYKARNEKLNWRISFNAILIYPW